MSRGPFFFFFFFACQILKPLKFEWGLWKWTIFLFFLQGKVIFHAGKKIGKTHFAPSEKYSSYATASVWHEIHWYPCTVGKSLCSIALARRSKFSDTARNPAKQRSISSAVLRSLMSVGNATDKAEWHRTYGQIPLFVRPPWSICTSGFYVSLENFIGFWTKSSREVGLPYMEPRRGLGHHIWLVMNYSYL